MATSQEVQRGQISWVDLTVPEADTLRDFYAQVVGWTASAHSMGDYEDYVMNDPVTGEARAGICHARGENAALPAQWLIYIVVQDLEDSFDKCLQLGGSVVCPPRSAGEMGSYCVIKDPAGAVCALFQPA